MSQNKEEYLWRDRKRTIFGLPLSFTVYSLDEERLFIKKGFLSTTEDEVRLYRIMDLSLTRSLWQRMFGVGTIKVSSGDQTLGDFKIESIKKSREIKEKLSALVEAQRDAKRVTSREFLDEDDFMDGEDNN